MKTIWKYDVDITDNVVLDMPVGAELLSVHPSTGHPATGHPGVSIWALVDPDAPTEQHTVHIRGTGHPVRHVGRFIGTLVYSRAALIFHVFDQEQTDA